MLSNIENDNEVENSRAFSVENDVVTRVSRYMKRNTFQYSANGKIYFEVG